MKKPTCDEWHLGAKPCATAWPVNYLIHTKPHQVDSIILTLHIEKRVSEV